MPIAGQYTWSETDSHIEIAIPLKGVSIKKVDVFTASNILKVSFAPFLLDLNLYKEIDEENSRAVFKNGTLKICLSKKESGTLWNQLCFEGTKEEVQQRREMALTERSERVKKQMENAAAKKVEEERMVFQQHMALEERERQRLDAKKAAEKKQAEDAVHETFTQLTLQSNDNVSKSQSENSNCMSSTEGQRVLISADNTNNNEEPRDSTTKKESNQQEDDSSSTKLDYSTEQQQQQQPPPRQVVQGTFTHTPRLFKTPSRESTIKQEQQFIMKNRSNLSKNVLLND